MAWTIDSDRPVYLQIVEHITNEIFSGRIKPGEQIKSVRDLATEAAVNPNTMQKALQELERIGLVFTRRTSGRYVTEDAELIRKQKDKKTKEQLDAFLERMGNIGISREDLIRLLKDK